MSSRTSEKLLQSAIQLMSERGYQDVSTKEIATLAGVSEMSLFRHFHTKMGILDAIIDRFSYEPHFHSLFTEKLQFDLRIDLMMIAKQYLQEMSNSRPLFLIALQEKGRMPQLFERISETSTIKLLDMLTEYIEGMQKKELIKEGPANGIAIQFLTTLFGYFVSTTLWEQHPFFVDQDLFISSFIDHFIQGIHNDV